MKKVILNTIDDINIHDVDEYLQQLGTGYVIGKREDSPDILLRCNSFAIGLKPEKLMAANFLSLTSNEKLVGWYWESCHSNTNWSLVYLDNKLKYWDSEVAAIKYVMELGYEVFVYSDNDHLFEITLPDIATDFLKEELERRGYDVSSITHKSDKS